MAARAGLTREDVVGAAVSMLDAGTPLAEISLGALARRLGIKPQSLYAHVDGTDGLARAVAAAGLAALADKVTAAGIGSTGPDAIIEIVRAHLRFAAARPGLYEAALHPPSGDPELERAIAAVGAPLEQVLAGMGVPPTDRVHWTRLFLSLVYGYVVLHAAGRFTLPVDTAETESRLVEMLTAPLFGRTAPVAG